MKAVKDFSTYRPTGTVKKSFKKGEEVDLPPADIEALKKKGYFEAEKAKKPEGK